MLLIGRIFFCLATLCFVIGMYSHFWSTALAEIESVHMQSKSGSGFSASKGSSSIVGGVTNVGLYKYRYSVNGNTYSAWGTNTQKIVSRHNASRQDSSEPQGSGFEPIKIYYLPQAPVISVTKRGVPLIGFCVLLFLGTIFWYVGRRYR